MTRPIKFKGQRVSDNKWVEGVPVESVNGKMYMIHGATEDAINTLNTVDFVFTEVIPETVCQFTGLLDKKGKEIYEGDVLESDNGVKYIVKWIEQIGGFYLSIPNTHRGKEIISCAASKVADEPMLLFKERIIGNRFDSPELIK